MHRRGGTHTHRLHRRGHPCRPVWQRGCGRSARHLRLPPRGESVRSRVRRRGGQWARVLSDRGRHCVEDLWPHPQASLQTGQLFRLRAQPAASAEEAAEDDGEAQQQGDRQATRAECGVPRGFCIRPGGRAVLIAGARHVRQSVLSSHNPLHNDVRACLSGAPLRRLVHARQGLRRRNALARDRFAEGRQRALENLSVLHHVASSPSHVARDAPAEATTASNRAQPAARSPSRRARSASASSRAEIATISWSLRSAAISRPSLVPPAPASRLATCSAHLSSRAVSTLRSTASSARSASTAARWACCTARGSGDSAGRCDGLSPMPRKWRRLAAGSMPCVKMAATAMIWIPVISTVSACGSPSCRIRPVGRRARGRREAARYSRCK
eukprot:scaffold5860_cov103-Isochrysis_galbana.AAC.9